MNAFHLEKYLMINETSVQDSIVNDYPTNNKVRLVLTNKRVLLFDELKFRFKDIKLNNIVSITWLYKSNPVYLYVAIGLFVLAGLLILMDSWAGLLVLLICAVVFYKFLTSKSCYIAISTTDGKEHKFTLPRANPDQANELCLNIRNSTTEVHT